MKNTDSIAQKIRELYAITTELESLYPGRKFTIDGQEDGTTVALYIIYHFLC